MKRNADGEAGAGDVEVKRVKLEVSDLEEKPMMDARKAST